VAPAIFTLKLAIALVADTLPVSPTVVVFLLTLTRKALLAGTVILLITAVAPVSVIAVISVVPRVDARVVAAVPLFDLAAGFLLLTCAFDRIAVRLNTRILALATLLVYPLLSCSLLNCTLLSCTLLS